MFKSQRLEEIMALLRRDKYMTVKALAKELFASEATIRRDIALMEQSGLITRSYGGVALADGKNRFVGLEQRTEKNQREKAFMAKQAAACVRDGDAIFMDASSSVLNMIPFLRQENLTVITNSLRVADKLGHTGARIFLTGGLLLESSKAFGGSIAERTIRGFHADKLFFSATGVSENGEISDYSELEAQLRRVMIECADQKYFLCDSSKFGKRYLFNIAHIEQVDHIISDADLHFVSSSAAHQD